MATGVQLAIVKDPSHCLSPGGKHLSLTDIKCGVFFLDTSIRPSNDSMVLVTCVLFMTGDGIMTLQLFPIPMSTSLVFGRCYGACHTVLADVAHVGHWMWFCGLQYMPYTYYSEQQNYFNN